MIRWILFYSIILAWAPLYSKDIITVVALDLVPLQNVKGDESGVVSEIIRSELIKMEFIRVIESDQLSNMEKESTFQQTGFTAEVLIDAGKRLKADYFLLGTMSRKGSEAIITTRVVSSITGENIHANIFYAAQVNIVSDLKLLSAQICSQVITATLGNTMDNIQRLVNRDDFENAEKRLEIFTRNFGHNQKTRELGDRITDGIAGMYLRQYKESVKRGDIKEAYEFARRLIKLKPGDRDSIDLYSDAIKKYDEFMKDYYNRQMKKCSDLISGDRHEEAKKLLDRFYMEEGSRYIDKKYYELYAELSVSMAKKSYRDAREFSKVPMFLNLMSMDEADYMMQSARLNDARERALYSIEKYPADGSYVSLLKKINDNSSDVYSAYIRGLEASALDVYISKLDWMVSIAPVFVSNRAADNSPLGQNSTYLGFELNLIYHMMIEEGFPGMILMGAGYIPGVDTRNDGRNSYRTTYTIANASLGMLFGFTISPFGYYLGPVAQAGGIYRTAKEKSGRGKADVPSFAVTAGFGAEARAVWHYDRNLFMYTGLRYIPTIAFGLPNKEYMTFSIGAGYAF